MKSLNIITRLLLVASICSISSYAQVTRDVMSIVRIGNVTQVNNSTIEFDLRLQRNNDEWLRWANGTFQLRIEGMDDSSYTTSQMSVELLPNSSELDLQAYANAPLTKYVITPRLFIGRISITVLGPDEFGDSKFVVKDSSVKIGRFRVSRLDASRIGTNLTWLAPLDYYQANAYKRETDSVKVVGTNGRVKWFGENDNIEMRDFGRIDSTNASYVRLDSFQIDAALPSCASLKTDSSFIAQYLGDKLVRLQWETLCEQNVQGYILRRRVVNCPGMDPSDLEFRETRRFGNPYDSLLFSRGNTSTGFIYEPLSPDTVKYRDVVYQYELSAIMFDGQRRYIDTTSVYIPNSVISTATAFPNPITTQKATTVRYTIEDRVRLSAKVYDVTGKELAVLLDKVITPKSPAGQAYTIRWDVPDQASQGLYNIVMIAYPVDDTSIELSRAIIKLQLLK